MLRPKYMKREHADIIDEINRVKALDEALETKLNQALAAFAPIYQKLIEG